MGGRQTPPDDRGPGRGHARVCEPSEVEARIEPPDLQPGPGAFARTGQTIG
jgi:hypothetical protein